MRILKHVIKSNFFLFPILICAIFTTTPYLQAINVKNVDSIKELRSTYLLLNISYETLEMIKTDFPELSNEIYDAKTQLNTDFPNILRKIETILEPELNLHGISIEELRGESLPHEKFTKEHAKEIINRIKNISKEAPPENLACMLAITYENNPSEEIAQGFRKNWDFIASEVKLSFTLPLSWQAKNDYTWQSEYGNGLEFLRIAIEHVDLEQLRNPQDAQDFRTKYIRIILPEGVELIDSQLLNNHIGYWVRYGKGFYKENELYYVEFLAYNISWGEKLISIAFNVTSKGFNKVEVQNRINLFKPLTDSLVETIELKKAPNPSLSGWIHNFINKLFD